MIKRISLLDELKAGGYEASLIATYNAFMPFYEEVVLRKLVAAGSRHNIVLMDAQQCSMALEDHRVSLAGRQYTLLPIRAAGAFHPKLILLVGKRKVFVAIGSHNLTISGFGFNRELTSTVHFTDTEASDSELLLDVLEAIDGWVAGSAIPLPDSTRGFIEALRDFAPPSTSKPIVSEHSMRLLSGGFGEPALWSQLNAAISGKVTRVAILGAFFDQQLGFLDKLRRDWSPEVLRVGVDARNVQLPSAAMHWDEGNFVDTTELGCSDDASSLTSSYLHSKAIYVEIEGGEVFCALGSANPSAPAWFADKSFGNAELMMLHVGSDAQRVAAEIGITEVFEMPSLSPSQWELVTSPMDFLKNEEPRAASVGIAELEKGALCFSSEWIKAVPSPKFVVTDAGNQSLLATDITGSRDGMLTIELSETEAVSASFIEIWSDELIARLIVQRTAEIRGLSTTGVKRQFSEALEALTTNSPNIGMLLDCIDRMAFEATNYARVTKVHAGGGSRKTSEGDIEDPESLGVDVEDLAGRRPVRRLLATTNIAYLIDAFIYQLGVGTAAFSESRDRMGRSEEEQIDSDDDEAEHDAVPPAKSAEILKECHSKVQRLVKRLLSSLEEVAEGRHPLEWGVVRILGVLGLLRELRSCDRRVAWVPEGGTTVPLPTREDLLMGLVPFFSEGETSFVAMLRRKDTEEIADSKDFIHLRALLLWLAWDSNFQLELTAQFNETDEQARRRLERNAVLVALAEASVGEDEIYEETNKSIAQAIEVEGISDWVRMIHSIATRCEQVNDLLEKQSDTQRSCTAGDLARQLTSAGPRIRVVLRDAGQFVHLVNFAKPKGYAAFKRESISTCTFS